MKLRPFNLQDALNGAKVLYLMDNIVFKRIRHEPHQMPLFEVIGVTEEGREVIFNPELYDSPLGLRIIEDEPATEG